jgi:predicted porin
MPRKKNENGSNLEEAYVGLKYNAVSFSFGKQNYASDEFCIEAAYEIKTIDEDRFDDTGTKGDDTLRVDLELDNVYVALSHEMDARDDGAGIDGEYYDVFVATDIADLTLAAAYQVNNPAGSADSRDTYGVSASYDFGFMNLAADYSVTDDNNTDFETKQ